MTNVNGIQGVSVPAVQGVSAPAQANPAVQPPAVKDTVEISSIAQLAAKIHDLPEVRAELVQRVKAEIAAGTYETPEKLEAALERLLGSLQ